MDAFLGDKNESIIWRASAILVSSRLTECQTSIGIWTEINPLPFGAIKEASIFRDRIFIYVMWTDCPVPHDRAIVTFCLDDREVKNGAKATHSITWLIASLYFLSKSSGKTYLRYHFMVFAMNKLFALAFYGVCLLITSFGASSYGV